MMKEHDATVSRQRRVDFVTRKLRRSNDYYKTVIRESFWVERLTYKSSYAN